MEIVDTTKYILLLVLKCYTGVSSNKFCLLRVFNQKKQYKWTFIEKQIVYKQSQFVLFCKNLRIFHYLNFILKKNYLNSD